MDQNTKTENGAAAPLRFGAFELDPRTGELRRSGVRIHLQPQPAKLLELLARRRGELVTREEIQRELWSGETYVDFERSINICVMQIRAALNDDAETPRFIETLPRRGYRFVAEVQAAGGHVAGAPPQAQAAAEAWRRRRRIAAVLVVMLGGGLAWKLWPGRAPVRPATESSRAMLAVLPFENLSGNDQLAYVADGMTEELIAQLGRVAPEKLGVIARTSAMHYRASKASVTQIGSELKVEYVVEGSVRLEKGRSWVTAQLIRVSDQTHLWADTYEMDGTSIFAQQQMAAQLVVQNVAGKLAPLSEASTAGHTPATSNPAALEAYLRGRYLFSQGGEIAEAVRQLQRAVAEDPQYADAQASLADALQFAVMIGQQTALEAGPKAIAAAERALLADAFSSEAHAARGLAAFWFEWDPRQAASHFEKALAANPSDAAAHHDYAWTLVALGRDEDAVREIQAAQAVDPLSPRANMDLGWIYLGVQRYDDAIRHCSRMLEIEPRVHEAAQSCLERAYVNTGKVAQAAAAAIHQYERNPALAATIQQWKKLPPQEALRAIWQRRLNERLSSASQRKAYRAAELCLQLGRKDEALRYLEQAFAEREMMLVLLHRATEFEALRGEPRFTALLARIKPAAADR